MFRKKIESCIEVLECACSQWNNHARYFACPLLVSTSICHNVRNSTQITVLPKMERRDIHYLTQTEQKRFIQHLPDCSVGRALYFILGTGIRAGELSGLRWSDIQDDRFTVRQTVRRNRDFAEDAPTHTHLEFGTPKSNAGHRTIPLATRMQLLHVVQRVKTGMIMTLFFAPRSVRHMNFGI